MRLTIVVSAHICDGPTIVIEDDGAASGVVC
jgi:hypothetical protein